MVKLPDRFPSLHTFTHSPHAAMSFRILRPRAATGFAPKRNLRFLCANANEASPALPLPLPPPPPPLSAASPGRRSFLKYAVVAALTGAMAFTGYVSYAYSLDKIDEKTKLFRESAKYTAAGDGGTILGKFQGLPYSTAMRVSAKVVELYLDARRPIEEIIRSYAEPYTDKLLPDLYDPQERDVLTLVLDLNETLIYYAWRKEIGLLPCKRPGVGAFLEHLAQFYEIVVYANEQKGHLDFVIDRLDTKHCITYKLSRAATKYQDGKYLRDLSKLNRDPAKVLYVSGHALENCLQPENCVPIKPCKQHDKDDTTLLDYIPFLESVARSCPVDVRPVLHSYQGFDIPTEFSRRYKDHQRRMQGFWSSFCLNFFFLILFLD